MGWSDCRRSSAPRACNVRQRRRRAQCGTDADPGASAARTVPRLTGTDWRVDYVIGSSERAAIGAPYVQLRLHVDGPGDGVSMEMTAERFRVLLNGIGAASADVAPVRLRLSADGVATRAAPGTRDHGLVLRPVGAVAPTLDPSPVAAAVGVGRRTVGRSAAGAAGVR